MPFVFGKIAMKLYPRTVTWPPSAPEGHVGSFAVVSSVWERIHD